MCEPTTIGLLISAVVGAGTMAQNDDNARRQQHANERAQELQMEANAAQEAAAKEANETSLASLATAQDQAKKSADMADQANNRANAKQPNTSKLSSANVNQAKGGQSGTLLTGPTGVDPKSLLLGKTTLLGG